MPIPPFNNSVTSRAGPALSASLGPWGANPALPDSRNLVRSRSVRQAAIPIDAEHDLPCDYIEGMRMKEGVTVAIPEEVVRDIDRTGHNGSRLILQAVHNELERRRKDELRRSLRAPHPESERLAQAGAGTRKRR